MSIYDFDDELPEDEEQESSQKAAVPAKKKGKQVMNTQVNLSPRDASRLNGMHVEAITTWARAFGPPPIPKPEPLLRLFYCPLRSAPAARRSLPGLRPVHCALCERRRLVKVRPLQPTRRLNVTTP